MLGICIALLSIIAAAYLIFKKYYAPGALLFVGLITLAVCAIISPESITKAVGKAATGNLGLDVIQLFTTQLQKETAALGMNIMAIAGFTYYMDTIGASKALVKISVKPLQRLKSPYLVMALGLALGIFLNCFIPSAAGLALLLMVSLYPVLVAAGVSRQSAAATVLIATCMAISPSGANNLMAADLTHMHVMEFVLNVQVKIAWVVIPFMLVVHFFVQKWLDKKDLASGAITKADFEVPDMTGSDTAANAPLWFAAFPLIPVVLLFFFSPIVYKGIKLEVVTAILVSTFIAFIINGIVVKNLKTCIGGLKLFAKGMGNVFTSTVFLIVCAEIFAKGLTVSGGIKAIIDMVTTMHAGAIPIYTVMFLVVLLSSFITGSGNAAFFSFAPMMPDIASQVGGNASYMLSSMQLNSGMGRSSSPIAGVTIAVAGLSGIDPFVLIRRSIPPMVVAAIVVYIRTLSLI